MNTKLFPWSHLAGLLMFFWSALAGDAAQQARLGIVPEAPELVGAAALATAELTRDGSVALVERADINRILGEQSLSAGQTTNYVKLGQMLGADGLLLIQLLGEGTNQTAVARLIAVKTGVVLGAARSAYPIKDMERWGPSLVARFKPLLPKLAVLPKEAVPISLLNLRAAATGPDTNELERQVTALLYLRLMAERDLFVLERQRMESLTWEKSLQGVDETAFWTGSYLLDGTIDRDGTQPGQVTVHLRLVPPQGGQPIVIPAQGKRDMPGPMIEKLAPQILEALKKRTVAPAWNAAQEAAKYLEEARWAHGWGMYHEAQTACEAAWALGSRDWNTATLRIHSYVDGMHSDAGAIMEHGRRTVIITKPPSRAALDMALRALDLYETLTAQRGSNEPDSDFEFKRQGVGLDVLEGVSRLLWHFYFDFRARVGREDQLATVRDRTRRLATTLETGRAQWEKKQALERGRVKTLEAQERDFERRVEEARKDAWNERDMQAKSKKMQIWMSLMREKSESLNVSVKQRQTTADIRPTHSRSSATLDQLELRYAPLWHESPQDVLPQYRNYFSRVSQPEQMGESFQQADRFFRRFDAPWLVAWNPAERGLKKAVWEGFISELLASTNAVVRLHGSLLRLQTHYPIQGVSSFTIDNRGKRSLIVPLEFAPEAMLQSDVERILDNLWDAREVCRTQGIQAGQRQGIYNVIRRVLRYWSAEERHPLEAKFDGMETRFSQYRTTSSVAEMKNFLNSAGPFDGAAFARVFFQRPELGGGSYRFTADEARELLPLVQAYHQRVAKSADGIGLLLSLESNLSRLAKDITPAAGTKPSPPPANSTATGGAGSSTVAARLWKSPVIKDSSLRDASGSGIESIRYRQGKFWIALTYMAFVESQGHGMLHALARVDPETLQTDVVIPVIPYTPAGYLAFDVEGEDVFYVGAENRVRRHNLKTGTHRDYDVPFPSSNPPTLSVLDGQLFLCAFDRIARLNLQDGQVQLLASNRRQPPETVLDGILSLNVSRVFKLADGRFGVLVADRTYAWDAKARNWLTLGAGHVETRALADVELLQTLWWYPQAMSFPHGQLQSLLRGDYRGPARWRHAGSLAGRLVAGSFDGSHAGLLVVPQGQRPFDGSAASFWYLHPRWAEPFEVPLSFPVNAPANAGKPPLYPLQLRGPGVMRLVMTPRGVILIVAQFPARQSDAFWLLSKQDLEGWVEAQVRARPQQPMDESAKPDQEARGLAPANTNGPGGMPKMEDLIRGTMRPAPKPQGLSPASPARPGSTKPYN